MSDTDSEENNAALFQEESDNEWTDTDSEQVTDYPDTDSDIVQEVMEIMDPPIYDQHREDQKLVNEQVAASLEDSVDSPFLKSETKRIYNVLVKHGLDYPDGDISLYSFHIANMYVNKIDFPDSLRDVLTDIVEFIGDEGLGYSEF